MDAGITDTIARVRAYYGEWCFALTDEIKPRPELFYQYHAFTKVGKSIGRVIGCAELLVVALPSSLLWISRRV